MRPTTRAASRRRAAAVVAGLVIAAGLTYPASPARAAGRPDLVVKTISSPPVSLAQGSSFSLTVKVKNVGRARAKRTVTGFYLSGDGVKGTNDVQLEGTWSVPALDPGQGRTKQVQLGVPLEAPVGVARVIVCADDAGVVRESKEANNCKTSAATVEIVGPRTSVDLIEAALDAGDIDEETAILYKVFATFGDARLPDAYRGDDRLVVETDALEEAAAAFDSLSAEARGTLAPFLMQPAYPGTWEEFDEPIPSAGPASAASQPDDPAIAEAPLMHPTPLGEQGWWFYEHLRARIWFRLEDPTHEQVASVIFANLTEIHDDLTGLMGRGVLSDSGPHPFIDKDGNPQTWGDGGSGLLDIYVVPINGARGLTVAYPPGCTGRPSFILVDPQVGINTVPDAASKVVRGSTAHEFMHVLQFTYTYAAPCADYAKLDETTANWAIDYVFPNDNFEHRWNDLMKYPHDPLWNGGYDGWVFPLYVEHTLGASAIPAIYSETQSKGPWAAVDSALPGGLEERWPEFAYYAWNQEPVEPAFASWDNLAAVPLADYNTPLDATLVSLGSAATKDVPIPISIGALARDYRRFSITDDVRWLRFRNDLIGKTGASVQALIKLGDGTWRTEDWTNEDHVTFCRDNPSDDVVELVLIFANSTFNELSNVLSSSDTKLSGRNLCGLPAAWSGTISGSSPPSGGTVVTTWEGSVTFSHPSGEAPVGLEATYHATSGTVTSRVSGTDGGGCTHTGEGTFDIPSNSEVNGEKTNFLVLQTQSDHIKYYAEGVLRTSSGANASYPVTVSCPDGYTYETTRGVTWIYTDYPDPTAPLGAQVLSGSETVGCCTWNWNLVAQDG